jgi:superfamily II DNA or RNA helicase
VSFVPVSGPATFRPAEPPRDGTIEFTDDRRTVALPVRAALPVLGRARRSDEVHPSVALIGGAALLATELVAAGKLAPADGVWHLDGLDDRDHDSIARLADARTYDGLDAGSAEQLVHGVLAAVADAIPRAAPTVGSRGGRHHDGGRGGRHDGGRGGRHDGGRGGRPATVTRPESDPPTFAERLQQRVAERARRSRLEELPELVRISLRVEADEEELVGGAVRVVLQVHDERDPLHVADAAVLWSESDAAASHGFGPRARVHASIALRSAAEVWPVLDRFGELAVPDQLTLDGEEIASLLEHVGALRDARVDVHWPRSLGRELTTRAVLDRRGAPRDEEQPLQDSPFSTDGLFDFSWQVALHGDPLTEEEMQQLAAAASPVLKLRGTWLVVDPATARRAKRRLIRKASGAQALAAALAGVVEVPASDGETEMTDEVVVGASLLHVRERLLAAATRDPLPAPAALRAELRDYQRHGLTWLADLTGLGLGACLADDMGLGKTVTLIALHLHRLEQGLSEGRPTLVVCPASLLGNWEAEIERFAPGTPVRRFHASERSLEGLDTQGGLDTPSFVPHEGGSTSDGGSSGFVLTTYGTMRVDADALARVSWDLVVADEAQHVKNSRSSTARALRRLPSRGRVALTGTPVENDLTELWSILDWAIPGLLGSRQAFRRVWAAPIESGAEPTKARQFADLIGPFLLRRRKTDPGIAPELPPKTETDQWLGLTREQAVLYEAFVRDSMERIERLPADDPGRRGLVLALLTGLKQICNHPAQFLKQSGAVRLGGRSEKLELLDELIGTVLAEDGAVLVFTQYVAMARLIEQHLAAVGAPHQFLHGGTPVREREAMVRRFAEGDVPVFLLSLKAGGTGLNLTRADHVIHVDRWWNPAVEEQATDRAYRIGQTKPVQVHRMVTRGTIEERVAALLERKRALADAVLARGEAALTELSNEELRDLVTLRREAQREAARQGE